MRNTTQQNKPPPPSSSSYQKHNGNGEAHSNLPKQALLCLNHHSHLDPSPPLPPNPTNLCPSKLTSQTPPQIPKVLLWFLPTRASTHWQEKPAPLVLQLLAIQSLLLFPLLHLNPPSGFSSQPLQSPLCLCWGWPRGHGTFKAWNFGRYWGWIGWLAAFSEPRWSA